jgi:uncharacterized protein (DUF1697 family)
MTKGKDVHVALMRGINVGGRNKLPMKDLARLFADAGCDDVHTYIQSGNVVFRASPALARRIPKRIAASVSERFDLDVPVIVRSATELHKAASRNPFLRAGKPTEALHVMFLADTPAAARVAALDPDRSPPDAFAVRGREIYLYCPGGVARTRLTNAYFDSRLATTGTGRNWRTVLKLVEMTGG